MICSLYPITSLHVPAKTMSNKKHHDDASALLKQLDQVTMQSTPSQKPTTTNNAAIPTLPSWTTERPYLTRDYLKQQSEFHVIELLLIILLIL
jgi:hypothetical protein